MKLAPHTSVRKGKRVIIILDNKKKIIDKFVEKKSSYIVTEEYGKIARKDIKSMSIYKQGDKNV